VKIELTEALWLDQHGSMTLLELAEFSGLTEADLHDLVDLGVFEPLQDGAPEPTFGPDCLTAARAACRLRDDFELDAHGVALVLGLIERVHELEDEVRALRANLPRVRLR
jgi:chaperone modulatory protein CbpM